MKKKALIIQPGKLGDLILLTPVAKFYHDLGYTVDIPTFSNFKSYFDNIDYINQIDFDISLDHVEYHNSTRMAMWQIGKSFEEQLTDPFPKDGFSKSLKFFNKLYEFINNNKYDLILDPCWGFPGHMQSEKSKDMILESIKLNKSWIETKYMLCDVQFSERTNFLWTRNTEKENELLDFIKNFAFRKYNSLDFSIVHSYKSDLLPKFNVINPINFSYIEGFEIYDWIKVLESSKNIVCVDSCLSHFVETQQSLKEIPKIYLGSEEAHWNQFMKNILKNNWINYSKFPIE